MEGYGLKYILRYETERLKTDVQVRIYRKGYVGACSFKKIGASRIALSKELDGKISGTSLSFSIQADVDLEYANFFSNDNREHYVELIYDAHEIFKGFIVSDQYTEPYIAPPYDVEVMCTDGLGLMKTKDFHKTGYISRMEAIRYCIGKIGLDLGYQINLDLWEKNMNPALHNMLEQLYFQAEIFYDRTCYSVMQSILPEGVTITQNNGSWLIERKADYGKSRWPFDKDGNALAYFESVVPYQLGTIELGDTHPIGSLNNEFQSGWKDFTIQQIFGKKQSFLQNCDFKKGAASWEEHGGSGFFKTIDLNNGTFGVITGRQLWDASPLKWISQSVAVKPSDVVVLDMNYAAVGYTSSSGILKQSPMIVDINLEVKLTSSSSGNIYYLDNSGWNLNVSRRIDIVKVESSIVVDAINFKNYKNICKKFPEPGTIEVRILQQIYGENRSTVINEYFYGIALEYVKLYTQNMTLFPDEASTKVVISEDATVEGKTIELIPTDLPVYENAREYFDNGNYIGADKSTAIVASKWGPSELSYLQYMAAFIANQYSNQRSKLKGQLAVKDGQMNLNKYIQHALNDNKVFSIDTGTWNVLDDTMDVEMVEVAPLGEIVTVDVGEPFDPGHIRRDHPDIIDYTEVGNEGSYRKVFDGSSETVIPGKSTPLIVSRKEVLSPYHLDYAAGTPQFSVKGAIVETGIDEANPNKISIGAGNLIVHNYDAQKKLDIDLMRTNGEEYQPERIWVIAETEITLPNDGEHWVYVKVPLRED